MNKQENPRNEDRVLKASENMVGEVCAPEVDRSGLTKKQLHQARQLLSEEADAFAKIRLR